MKFTYKQKTTAAVICTLVIGYIFGCLCIRAFYMSDLSYLTECIKDVLSGKTGSGALSAFADTALYLAAAAFLGYSMCGFILIFPLIFLKAYMTGFYATLCYIAYGVRGGLVVGAAIMPVSLLTFMLLCVLGAEAAEFSYLGVCRKSENRRALLKKYSVTCAVTCLIGVGLALWSMFLTPHILDGILKIV